MKEAISTQISAKIRLQEKGGGTGEDLKRFGAGVTAQEGRSLLVEPVARWEPEGTAPGPVEAC